MNYRRTMLLIVIALWSYLSAFGQDTTYTFLKEGEKCPDFRLKNIKYFNRGSASLRDFQGKWLVLDFWNKYCEACVRSFPETNKLQERFKNQVQFILIGDQDPENQIGKIYERFRQKFDLKLPVTFDSSIFKLFNIGPCPFIIVIDKNGFVKATTISLNETVVADLLENKQVSLTKAENIDDFGKTFRLFDSRKPLLVNGNGGGNDTDFLFRSLLARWRPGWAFGFNTFISSGNGNKVQFPRSTLSNLFKVAYGDTISSSPGSFPNCYYDWYYAPILEMKDSSNFVYDFSTGKNLFAYSLIVPKESASPVFLKECMQRDLKNYFGYEVTIEKRKMPCYELIATPEARSKLLTKGGPLITDGSQSSPIHLNYRNVPVYALIRDLYGNFQSGPPFIDETGITGNIDIRVDAVLSDFDDFRKGLQKNGLDIIKGEREMKVIVIRDARNE